MTNVESVAIEAVRLRAGIFPASHKYQTFGGCGSGRVCAGCGAVIPKGKMEIEVAYGPKSGMDSLVLHVKCFSAWLGTVGGGELECSQDFAMAAAHQATMR